MSHQSISLSYGTRREVLAQIALRYQEATEAQKTLLLDQCVELTGYGRKYVITLLNHVPESNHRIVRPRLPVYGPAVQEALFLAWSAIQYSCAQRLVPSLPSMILSDTRFIRQLNKGSIETIQLFPISLFPAPPCGSH